MADADHYRELADGLEAAAKAARACAQEEAGENEGSEDEPAENKSGSMKEAGQRVREYAQRRKHT